jgi:8-oxo-dGTP diphosphatase
MKSASRFSRGLWSILKEGSRHVLRHPVVGVAIAARTASGLWVLIRRRDTGGWALPGGTAEWGETLAETARRELIEEAGVRLLGTPTLLGVYSRPERDYRFHAVTVLVNAVVGDPEQPPQNPLEITEVGLFLDADLPSELSLSMTDLLADARAGRRVLE